MLVFIFFQSFMQALMQIQDSLNPELGNQRLNSSGVQRAKTLTGFVFPYQNAIKIQIPSSLCIKFVQRSHFLAINS